MYRTEHRQNLFGREHPVTEDNITLIGFVAYLAHACGQSGCVNGCIHKTQHKSRQKILFNYRANVKTCQFSRITTEIQTNITYCFNELILTTYYHL